MKGFTLIELLVVVLIIGILAAIALPQYMKAVEKSRAAEAISLIRSINQAEQMFYMASGRLTDDLTELDMGFSNMSGNSSFRTNNFNISVSIINAGADTLVIQAARAKNGIAITTGDFAYTLRSTSSSQTFRTTFDAVDGEGNACHTSFCKSIVNYIRGE